MQNFNENGQLASMYKFNYQILEDSKPVQNLTIN